MFAMGQKVIVSLTPAMSLAGVIVKVSYSMHSTWYGVLLDSGVEINGVESAHVKGA